MLECEIKSIILLYLDKIVGLKLTLLVGWDEGCNDGGAVGCTIGAEVGDDYQL